MDIIEENASGVTTMALRGRLDASSAPILETRVLELIASGQHHFVLDLEQLETTTSVGLRVLLLVAKRLAPLDGRIVLCAPRPTVRSVLEYAGFDAIFKVCGDRREAAAAVRPAPGTPGQAPGSTV